jgi:type I restriction enzyme R subunit
MVEHYAQWDAWPVLTTDAAGHLAVLPSTHKDDDEDAKRFDLLILRRQLAQLEGDAVAAERLHSRNQLRAFSAQSRGQVDERRLTEVVLKVGVDDDLLGPSPGTGVATCGVPIPASAA